MTEANWQRYMADFMVELRAALPGAEIVHDVLWFKGDTRADIVRELDAADAVALEKASRPGSRPRRAYGWESLAGYVERRQAAGQGVILDTFADAAAARLYGLATALLLDTRHGRARQRRLDRAGPLLARLRHRPRRAASGRARLVRTSWRRDFADGIVLVNPPGSAARVGRRRPRLRRPRRRRPRPS